MGRPDLNESIEALRAEVRRIEVSHPEDTRLLAELLSDLERAAKPGAPAPGAVSKVREVILHFEVVHPQVTAVLNDVLVSLGNVGM